MSHFLVYENYTTICKFNQITTININFWDGVNECHFHNFNEMTFSFIGF